MCAYVYYEMQTDLTRACGICRTRGLGLSNCTVNQCTQSLCITEFIIYVNMVLS